MMNMTESKKVKNRDDRADRLGALVGLFQCPGCTFGSGIDCGKYHFDANELRCTAHVLGTSIENPGNKIALGLPKGFCKPGFSDDEKTLKNIISIRLFPEGERPEWNNLNVPVWAMVANGYLFVRTFAPRIDVTWVDVIEGGNLNMVPGAIDVAKFIDEID